jgi:hypothetical protein
VKLNKLFQITYGIPAGEPVNDPDFPMQEEKYFRVPEVPAAPVVDGK